MTTCGAEHPTRPDVLCDRPFEPEHDPHQRGEGLDAVRWDNRAYGAAFNGVPPTRQGRDDMLNGMARRTATADHAPNPERPTLFDPTAAAAARQAGINDADDHANEIWKQDAYEAVRIVSTRLDDFTSDEVWEELQGTLTLTHEPAALGPVMLKACRDGIIIKTDELRKTKIPRRHRDLVVWRSALRIPQD